MTQTIKIFKTALYAARVLALAIITVAAVQTVMVAAIGRGPVDAVANLVQSIERPAVDTAPLGKIPAAAGDLNAQVKRTPLVLPVRPGTADQLLAAVLGPDSDASPAQAAQLHEAADRVCEGFTAQVPLSVMEPELMREFGFTGLEAHQFVITAHGEQCPLA